MRRRRRTQRERRIIAFCSTF